MKITFLMIWEPIAMGIKSMGIFQGLTVFRKEMRIILILLSPLAGLLVFMKIYRLINWRIFRMVLAPSLIQESF